MRLDKVSISIGKEQIIEPLDLTVKKGEIVVLMGPSGSGKTTLLKGIAGLLPITSGMVEGNDNVGIAFQEPRLFPHLSVLDNLAFGLRVQGYSKKDRYEIVRQYLAILQLDGLENRYPHQLSGGQKQRVSLGRALVLRPDILLLDEPFSSLDTSLRLDLMDWLYELQQREGFSILWVTHYIDEAFAVADRIGVLMNGRLLQLEEPTKVYQQPATEKVAAFFALSNRFERETWERLLPEGQALNELGWIAPEDLVVGHGHQDMNMVWVTGEVNRVKYEKNGLVLVVGYGDQQWDIYQNANGTELVKGQSITFGIPVDKVRWYPYEKK